VQRHVLGDAVREAPHNGRHVRAVPVAVLRVASVVDGVKACAHARRFGRPTTTAGASVDLELAVGRADACVKDVHMHIGACVGFVDG